MSDGDEEPSDDATDAESSTEISADTLENRLADADEALEAAETEADLDDVEADLDNIESDLEAANLPEPEDDDEDDPREELESTLSDLRDSLEEQRGPYGEDVVSAIEEAKSTISDTRWTERGESEIAEAVSDFTATVADDLDGDFAPDGESEEALLDALDDVAAAVTAAGFDADDDEATIASLVEATDALADGLEESQEWDDLETHEKLQAEGFYDVLGHYKDYPPEWSALKEWEQRGNVEMIVLAMENLQSDFMERHCVEALTRMNDDAAYDALAQKASRRDKPAVKAMGKMAAEEAVETLIDYVDTDSDPALQKVTFKALGEIGSEEATQALANKLAMENDNVRPYAARALGLVGDTRAVEPLTDTLANDESDTVRAAAAWALRQIGTKAALEAAAEYVDDRSYIVQHEAEKAEASLSVEQTA